VQEPEGERKGEIDIIFIKEDFWLISVPGVLWDSVFPGLEK